MVKKTETAVEKLIKDDSTSVVVEDVITPVHGTPQPRITPPKTTRKIPVYADIVPEDFSVTRVMDCNLPRDSIAATTAIKALATQLKSSIFSVPDRYFIIMRTLKVIECYLEYHFKQTCASKNIVYTKD